MPREVKASVLHGANNLQIERRMLEEPGADEVQVSIRATGLCGSDLHYWQHGRNGDIVMREPLTLGHESAGSVTAIGSGVKTLRVGDRVALEVGEPCDACDICDAGRYNLCAQLRFRSSAKSFPHFQGTLQDRINHPAKWCWKLPTELTYEHGALIEPLSVALHALDRSGIGSDQRWDVLVFGAGAVGVLVAAALRMRTKAQVVIADVDEGRVTFAVDNHFAHRGVTVPMKRGSTTDEKLAIAKENAALSSDKGFDVVFECTGQEICLQSSIYAAKAGGKVLMIGMGTPIQTTPISAAALREVDLIGVFRYAHTYERCIAMLQQAETTGPDILKVITHRLYSMEDTEKAFQLAGRPVDENGNMVMKVCLEWNDSFTPR